jgi:hypothetical protein
MRFRGVWVSQFIVGAISIAALTTAIAMLSYIGYFSRPDFSSDDAVLNTLAAAMYDKGKIFPHGWITANSDIIVPSAANFIAPVLGSVENGFQVHAYLACAMACTLWLLMICTLRVVNQSTLAMGVAILLLAGGFSRSFTWMLYTQTTYFWWPAQVLFSISIIVVLRRYGSNHFNARSVCLLFALFVTNALISISNPSRIFVLSFFPMLIFNRALANRNPSARESKNNSWMRLCGPWSAAEVALLSAFAFALIVYYSIVHHATIVPKNISFLRLAEPPEIWSNLRIFLNGWFDYLGASMDFSAQRSWVPFLHVVRTVIGCALTAVIFLESSDWVRGLNPTRRPFFIAFLAAFLPVLLLYLFFSPLAQNEATIRYFSVSIVLLVFIASWRVADWAAKVSMFQLTGLAVICLLLSVAACYRMLPTNWSSGEVGKSSSMKLADVLVREGLDWGYASYWFASATTVQSGFKVRVSPVWISTTAVQPYPVMVEEKWYGADSHAGTTFLALSNDEVSPAQLAYLDARFGPVSRSLDLEGVHIRIYDHNICKDFEPPAIIPESIVF